MAGSVISAAVHYECTDPKKDNSGYLIMVPVVEGTNIPDVTKTGTIVAKRESGDITVEARIPNINYCPECGAHIHDDPIPRR